MAGRQRIDRVRRQYNQWVANQTLEDYALRFTAKSARRWSAARVANTALGAISILALEAIGGTITLNYGATNATVARRRIRWVENLRSDLRRVSAIALLALIEIRLPVGKGPYRAG